VNAALLAAIVHAEDPPATQPSGGSSQIFMFVMLGVVAVAMFLMSRRNRKKQGDVDAFRSELAPGQRVLTASGLVGLITRVEGDIITVASGRGDESQWIRRAIRSLVPDNEWEAMIAEYTDDDQTPGDQDETTDDSPDPDTAAHGGPDDDEDEPGIQRY
jgi:preprotein translocase subunit YajC